MLRGNISIYFDKRNNLETKYVPIFLLQTDNGFVYTPDEKVKVFADSLETTLQLNKDITDRPHKTMLGEKLQEDLNQCLTTRPFNAKKKEVAKPTRKLDTFKSPGPDGTETIT